MHAFVSVSMIVVFVVHVVIPSDVESQSTAADKFVAATTRRCKPECSPGKISPRIRSAADAAFKKYGAFARRMKDLESKNELLVSETHRCPCNSCQVRREVLHKCGKCYVYKPYGGIVNTNCGQPNARCKVGCGCNGKCRMQGRAFRWVLLYCPGRKPSPWLRKTVRVCTNCCCIG